MLGNLRRAERGKKGTQLQKRERGKVAQVKKDEDGGGPEGN